MPPVTLVLGCCRWLFYRRPSATGAAGTRPRRCLFSGLLSRRCLFPFCSSCLLRCLLRLPSAPWNRLSTTSLAVAAGRGISATRSSSWRIPSRRFPASVPQLVNSADDNSVGTTGLTQVEALIHNILSVFILQLVQHPLYLIVKLVLIYKLLKPLVPASTLVAAMTAPAAASYAPLWRCASCWFLPRSQPRCRPR